MLDSLACVLLATLLQTATDTPPEIDGTELPSVRLEVPDNHGGLNLFQFSPDGTLLAGATGVGTMTSDGVSETFGGEVLLWDPVAGSISKVFGAHRTTPTTLAFSADGSRLLSYSREDHNARLWSVPDGRLIADVSLGGPGSRKQPPVLSPDGSTVLHLAERTLELGKGIEVSYLVEAWHLEEGRRLWTRSVEEPTAQLDVWFDISPDGKSVALSSVKILWAAVGEEARGAYLEGAHELLSLESGTPIWSVPLDLRSSKRRHPAKQLLFTPDGSGVLMVDRETMHHYAVADGSPVGEPIDLEADESVEGIHFSADGDHFMVTRFFDRSLEVRRFPSGEERFRVAFDFPAKLNDPGPAPDLRRVAGRIGFSDPAVIDLASGFAANPE